MIGVKKYNPSLTQGSSTITEIDNKKNMQNKDVDKIIILFFILYAPMYYVLFNIEIAYFNVLSNTLFICFF